MNLLKRRHIKLAIKYLVINSIPDDDLMDNMKSLYSAIFKSNIEDFNNKIKDKSKILFNIALDGNKLIGFKIGNELNTDKFYSWLGGVDPSYRKQGIASKLMEQQHQYLREYGYKVIQTKTMNKWRCMLLLNIKNGVDVVETYTDKKGLHKIILEKKLLN